MVGDVIGQRSPRGGNDGKAPLGEGNLSRLLPPGRRQHQRKDQRLLMAQSSPPWASWGGLSGPAPLRWVAAAGGRLRRPHRAGPVAPRCGSWGPRPFPHTLSPILLGKTIVEGCSHSFLFSTVSTVFGPSFHRCRTDFLNVCAVFESCFCSVSSVATSRTIHVQPPKTLLGLGVRLG